MGKSGLKDKLTRLYAWVEKLAGGSRNMEKLNYLVFGGLTTVVNYVVFIAVNALIEADYGYLAANGAAWVVSVAFAFVTNKIFVFQSKTRSRAGVLREAGAFVAARIASLLFDYGWMILAVEALKMHENIAKLPAYVVIVVMNYLFSKLVVFKRVNEPSLVSTASGYAPEQAPAAPGYVPEQAPAVPGYMPERRKRGRPHLMPLSFFMPVALLIIAFAVIGVYPMGKNSILIIDNHHQYTPFLLEFGEMLREGRSMLYSWTAGLGSNYLSRFAYYLSSPLNLFSVFVKDSYATEFVLALVLIRAGAAGLMFFIYLRAKFRSENYLTVAFAVMYSLCGYFLAYYWNIMWFDCIAVFPLVALGIERLADRGSGLLYCLALAYTIMANYFIAIMVCIYSALYFIAYLAGRQNMRLKQMAARGGAFAIYSLLAGALSAIITLPAYFGLLNASAAGAKLPGDARFYFNLIDIVANHLALNKPSIMVGLPNIYCGISVLLLTPLYFLNREIPLREKISNGALACFFIISFNVNTLDFLWHGTHFPNSLFFRFAFLYVFLILTISYQALTKIEKSGGREVFTLFALLLGFILFMEIQPSEKTTKWTVYGSFIFALTQALAMIMLIRERRSARRGRSVAELALAVLICVEIGVNAGYGIGEAGIFPKQSYLMKTGDIKPAVGRVGALEDRRAGGDGFERMEFTTHTTYNTAVVYGYKGVSYYSSTSYVAVNEMFGKLGLIDSIAWYVYRSAPPTFNSMFAIKHLLSQDGEYFNGIYPEKDVSVREIIEPAEPDLKAVYAYENPYFLPVGFMVDEAAKTWNLAQSNPFLIQEEFYKLADGGRTDRLFHRLAPLSVKLDNMNVTALSGAEGTYRYTPVDASRDIKATYKVTADRDGPVYFYIKCPQIELVKVNNYSLGALSEDDKLSILSRESGVAGANAGRGAPDAGFSDSVVGRGAPDAPLYAGAAPDTTSDTGGALVAGTRAGGSGGGDAGGGGAGSGGAGGGGGFLISGFDPGDPANPVYPGNQGGAAAAAKVALVKEHDIKYPYVIDGQYVKAGDDIEIELSFTGSDAGSFTLLAYAFDEAAFGAAWERLSGHGLEVTGYTDTSLSGAIDVAEPGLLYTSIPYSGGWKATVDGMSAEITTLGNGALAAVALGPGRHTISFKYTAPGLFPGALISLCAALLLTLLTLRKKITAKFTSTLSLRPHQLC